MKRRLEVGDQLILEPAYGMPESLYTIVEVLPEGFIKYIWASHGKKNEAIIHEDVLRIRRVIKR